MINIYKVPQHSQRFSEFTANDVETIKHDFNITATTLDYVFTVGAEIIHSFSITLEEFKASSRFTEQSWFGFQDAYVNALGDTIITKNPDHVALDRVAVVNYLDYTAVGKTTVINQRRYPGWGIPFKVFVKTTDDNFTTMQYSVHVPDAGEWNHTTIVTLNGAAYTLLDYIPWVDFIAPITATTAAATMAEDETIVVNVSTDPALHYVYLEKVEGSVNRNKVKLVNGQGSFNLTADGIPAGDQVEAKIGFKSFSNVTTFTKTVS